MGPAGDLPRQLSASSLGAGRDTLCVNRGCDQADSKRRCPGTPRPAASETLAVRLPSITHGAHGDLVRSRPRGQSKLRAASGVLLGSACLHAARSPLASEGSRKVGRSTCRGTAATPRRRASLCSLGRVHVLRRAAVPGGRSIRASIPRTRGRSRDEDKKAPAPRSASSVVGSGRDKVPRGIIRPRPARPSSSIGGVRVSEKSSGLEPTGGASGCRSKLLENPPRQSSRRRCRAAPTIRRSGVVAQIEAGPGTRAALETTHRGDSGTSSRIPQQVNMCWARSDGSPICRGTEDTPSNVPSLQGVDHQAYVAPSHTERFS